MLILLTACGPTPTAVATVPVSNVPIPTPQVETPTAPILPTEPGLPATETSGLWLNLLSPLDEALVDAPQVDVTGSAPAGTVISVNDLILIVGIDGQFTATVPLEEGLNLIEVVASNEKGNELSALLTVTYEP